MCQRRCISHGKDSSYTGSKVNTIDDPFAPEANLILRRLKKRAEKILGVDPTQLDLFLEKLGAKVEQSAQVLDHIINDKTKAEKKTETRGLQISPDQKIADLENRLELMNCAADATHKHSSISLFFEDTARQFSRGLNSNLFFILFYSHSSQSLKARLGYGPSAAKIQPKLEVPLSKTTSLLVETYSKNEAISITAKNIDVYSKLAEKSLFSLLLTTNIAAVPINLKEKVVGVILVCREAGVLNFSDEDLRLITSYSKNITQVLRKGVL